MSIEAEIREAVSAALAPLAQKIDRLEAKLDPPKEWLTIKEAEAHFDVSASTLYRWIDEGSVETRGKGKARRIRA